MADHRRVAGLLEHWRPIALVLGVVVLGNVLVQALVVRQLVGLSGDREQILASQRSRLEGVRTELESFERTASKVACVRADVEHVFGEMLSSKVERMTAIQRDLRRLASSKGLDPDRISYSSSDVRDTGLVRFEMQFPLEGEYGTLRDFIDEVESSPNFLIVEDITIREERDQASRIRLRLQVKLSTYFLSPDMDALRAAFPGVGT